MSDLRPFDGSLPYFPHEPPNPARPDAAAPAPAPAAAGKATAMTVLFVWELGAGLGHLMQMLPLAQDLARAGHRVFVALRDLDRAAVLYAPAGVWFLQAPISLSGTAQFPRPATYGTTDHARSSGPDG